MRITALVEAMVAAGATPDMILVAVRAYETDKRGFLAIVCPPGKRLPSGAWKKTRQRILHRDGSVCSYCGDTATEVDHVVPISLGGANQDANLVACCSHCNRSKGAKPVDEWRARH